VVFITPGLIDAIWASDSWGDDGGGGAGTLPTLSPLDIGSEKWVEELCEMEGIEEGGGIMAEGLLLSPVFLRFTVMSTGGSSDLSRFRGVLGAGMCGGSGGIVPIWCRRAISLANIEGSSA
jgi:hypothetical protein